MINTILEQCVTTQPGRNKLKTSEYEKTESVLLEQFRQKWALYVYQFKARKHTGPRNAAMSVEHKNVTEEKAGVWKMGASITAE